MQLKEKFDEEIFHLFKVLLFEIRKFFEENIPTLDRYYVRSNFGLNIKKFIEVNFPILGGVCCVLIIAPIAPAQARISFL